MRVATLGRFGALLAKRASAQGPRLTLGLDELRSYDRRLATRSQRQAKQPSGRPRSALSRIVLCDSARPNGSCACLPPERGTLA